MRGNRARTVDEVTETGLLAHHLTRQPTHHIARMVTPSRPDQQRMCPFEYKYEVVGE